MRLGIVSDVHCEHAALRSVAQQLVADGVDEILLAGDAHYEYRFSSETVDVIREFDVRCVAGNHDVRVLGSERALRAPHVSTANVEFMRSVPDRVETRVGGKRLTMVHANPWAPGYDYLFPGNPIFARVDELDTDYLVLGHTHVPMVARVGRTLVINPGALLLTRDPDYRDALTSVVLDTDADEATIIRTRCDRA